MTFELERFLRRQALGESIQFFDSRFADFNDFAGFSQSVDPPVGGTAADGANQSATIAVEGLYRVVWRIQQVAGATGRFWSARVLDPADNVVWATQLLTQPTPDVIELPAVFLRRSWDLQWRNVDALADADVTYYAVHAYRLL